MRIPQHLIAAILTVSHLRIATALLHPTRLWTHSGQIEKCDPDTRIILRNTRETTSGPSASSSKILDYGEDVTGYPTFFVSAASGKDILLEVKYGETRAVLDLPMADGPLPMAAAMDSYRVNHYHLEAGKSFKNRLLQGGFRYQKFTLLSPGSVTLTKVGVEPAAFNDMQWADKGSFVSSDEDLNNIWQTGARTLELSSIPANTIPPFWNVTTDGAVVDSLIPQVLSSDIAAQLTEYNVAFEVKPTVGGFGFMVLGSTLNSGIYIDCDVGQGTIKAYSGSASQDAFIAGTNLTSKISLGTWHSVTANVSFSVITVAIDNRQVFNFTQTVSFYGSFGLGASFGHSATFQNLSATLTSEDSIYSNSLTHSAFLDDFAMGTNPLNVIVDGSKRDRIAYSGDMDIEVGAAYASGRVDHFIVDSIELLRSYQASPGFFIPTVKIQQPLRTEPLDVNITGLIGYSFDLVLAMSQSYQLLGNLTLARTWTPNITAMLDWAHSETLPNGLFNLSQSSFGGDWNYYDPSQSGVVTKFNTVYAYALQQAIPLLHDAGLNATVYQTRLKNLRNAINIHLWSEKLGAYVLSESQTGGFAQDANALAILADVVPNRGNRTATKLLETMSKELMTIHGPLSFSSAVIKAGWKPYISPYASSYHLRAALEANDQSTARSLLKTLWAPMADPKHDNYTGCFWETLDTESRPALGSITSMCHGWAAGPTTELTQHVLGIKPAKPGFKTWEVRPQTLGSRSAKGVQQTPLGAVEVEWWFRGGMLEMFIRGPVGTKGIIYLPSLLETNLERSVLRMNGKALKLANNTSGIDVKGGERVHITQSLKYHIN